MRYFFFMAFFFRVGLQSLFTEYLLNNYFASFRFAVDFVWLKFFQWAKQFTWDFFFFFVVVVAIILLLLLSYYLRFPMILFVDDDVRSVDSVENLNGKLTAIQTQR